MGIREVPGLVVNEGNSLNTPDVLEVVWEGLGVLGPSDVVVVVVGGASLKTPADILKGGLKVVTSPCCSLLFLG